MISDRHRLGQRRVLGRKPIGNRQQQAFRQAHVFGIAAGVVIRVADRLDAAAAQENRERANARTGFQRLLGAWSELDDLGAELMAHHDVAAQVHPERAAARALDRIDHLVGELQRMQIGAADSACEGFDQHFAGSESRDRHFIDDEFFVSHYRGAHRKTSEGRTSFAEYHIAARNPQEMDKRCDALHV